MIDFPKNILNPYNKEFECVNCKKWFIPNKTKSINFCSDNCEKESMDEIQNEYESKQKEEEHEVGIQK